MRKQYRNPLMASIHETAEGLHAAGVMDKRTMREFDELCLTPVRLQRGAINAGSFLDQACFRNPSCCLLRRHDPDSGKVPYSLPNPLRASRRDS